MTLARFFLPGGAEGGGASAAGDVSVDDSGFAVVAGADVQAALASADDALAAVVSGTYSPAVAAITPGDLSAAADAAFSYMRIGNTVRVSGLLDVTAGSLNGNNQIDMSLPIATASLAGLSGMGVGNTLPASSGDVLMANGLVIPSGANARLYFTLAFANNPASFSMAVEFTYTIS